MEVNHLECLACYSVPDRPCNQRKRKTLGELNGTVNKLALYSRPHKSPTTAHVLPSALRKIFFTSQKETPYRMHSHQNSTKRCSREI